MRAEKRIRATCWAIYLGANTVKRLALEWNVSQSTAHDHMVAAYEKGYATRRESKNYYGRSYVYETGRPT